ncbi:MAG: heme lyase CcmF/NrfE family subunit [Rhizobiales bacterium]|nr:heme lyase CcmF/NrfE family subunit [Hyphomicrobiales bacterium]
MTIELGHFALLLAVAVSFAQMCLPFVGMALGDARLPRMAVAAAQAQLALLVTAFISLTIAYVGSDFSVRNVYENSHSAKPLIYRLSGVWGNHEGSMLLWVLILALFGAGVATFGQNLHDRLKANVLGVQGAIGFAFLLFIALTSNPFSRIDPAPVEGQGLNPILQDPALAFHPPFLYAGYVGFSIAFAFAVAALIDGRIDAVWARWVRPWTLAAWMFLTLGIAMGSWWAYYELGWGGWWFWDPVENASFMPWLAGTALLHSASVMEKRDTMKVWTILLAIMTFSLSLLGAFLVRSGVLTSVHAFAVDPERGAFILAIMGVFIGGALGLFAWRAPLLRNGGIFSPISREASLVLNNLLLTVFCAAVLIGTLYPLLLEARTGEKISVGPPYFNMVTMPLMLPLLLALPFGPLLSWKRGDLLAASERLYAAAAIGLLVPLVLLAVAQPAPWLALVGAALGVWVILGAVSEWAWRIRLHERRWSEAWTRARGLPRSSYGTLLAHAGVGVMVLGIVGSSGWMSERIVSMRAGETVSIAGYTLRFDGTSDRMGPNYRETVGTFAVLDEAGAVRFVLEPSKRLYVAPRQATTEAGIRPSLLGDLYLTLGDSAGDGSYAVRVNFHPLVRWIWIGAVIMFFAAIVSLSDRRLRIGAPRLARSREPVTEGA